MANHCIEAICASCGAMYCLRCSDADLTRPISTLEREGLQSDPTMRYSMRCRFCNKTELFPLSNLLPIISKKSTS